MKYDKESYISYSKDPNEWENHVNIKTFEECADIIQGDVLDIGCNHGAVTYCIG